MYNGIEIEKNFVSRDLKVDVGDGIFSVSLALVGMPEPYVNHEFWQECQILGSMRRELVQVKPGKDNRVDNSC